MKKIYLFIIFGILATQLFAQTPYFQQKVNYNIRATLLPTEKAVRAYETIEYVNNSPDTLTFIYFHLWANGYKNRRTELAKQLANENKADLYFYPKKFGGYIDSLNFTSNNEELQCIIDKKNIDICKIILSKPLFPGDSVEISTPFYLKLPASLSRMCYSDSIYQLTQWYPKPAVYDNYGWHQFPYLDQGEFYSEFGRFDVYITVPKQFVVASTGNLHNSQEYQWLKKLAALKLTGEELPYPDSNETKTLYFSDSLIHDFAWFTSPQFMVVSNSVQTPNTHRTVHTWAFYPKKDEFTWNKAAIYVNNAIKYYSLWLGDYPYNNCSAVDGALKAGGGMEYPEITVISSSGIDDVIFHEVGHNWLYGILGFNERRYPFLDEGINSYYDHRYSYEIKNKTPMIDIAFPDSQKRMIMSMAYSTNTYFGKDQPLNLIATDYSLLNYGLIVYEKSANAFHYLESYLGKQTYDSIMQKFYAQWQFKHPYPQDLEDFFKKSTDKNLDWFFKGYVNTDGYSDYSINFHKNAIILKNKGIFAAPTCVVGFKDTVAVDTFWFDPIQKKTKINVEKYQFTHFIIDPYENTLDLNRYNNYTKTKDLFGNYDKFKLKPMISVASFYNKTLSFFAVPFYDNASKFQIVAFLTNFSISPKKFSYFLMPVYSFGYHDIEGYGYCTYRQFGYDGLPDISYSLSVDRYTYGTVFSNFLPTSFRKIEAQITMNLRNMNNSSHFANQLEFNFYMLYTQTIKYSQFADLRYKYTKVFNIQYESIKKSSLYPFSFKMNADIYSNNQFVFWMQANYHIHYLALADGFDIRLFAGINSPLTGTTGSYDNKFDDWYISRYSDYQFADGFWSHQFNDNFGGFTFFNNYHTNDLVFAANLKTTFPKVPIIKIYANIGISAELIPGTFVSQFNFGDFLYEGGIMFDIIPDFISFYFPLIASQQLTNYTEVRNIKWYNRYRFTFKLENFDKIISKIQSL